MKAYCFFYIRDKFQIYPAKTKREIDFKVDTVLHGLLWAKTGVRSNVIRSGTLKPFDKSLWKKYQRSQIGSSISGFFFMCLRFFFTLWRGLTLTWGLMEKRGCPVFGGGYCILLSKGRIEEKTCLQGCWTQCPSCENAHLRPNHSAERANTKIILS